MTQETDKNIYRLITKAAALFGGVQIVSILCSVIRTKLIAVWLGSAGIGIIGLYNTAIETISAFTGLGIRSSSVREISEAESTCQPQELSRIVTVVRRWSWMVGLLGATVMMGLAPLLSQWTFGDSNHIWGFVVLSCTLLFNALLSGEQAILQGTRQLKALARCSVYGAIAALIASVPLYYIWKLDGIVPSLIIYAAVTCIVTLFYRDKKISPANLSTRQTLRQGRNMITLGVFMTISSFITTLFSYIFSAYLNHRSGESAVGYYQAGFTLMNKYVGLIFTAMAMEYYPRLSGIRNDTNLMSRNIGQQSEMMLLMLAPIITLFIVLHPLMVRILYTSDFYVINDYLLCAIQGMPFKAVSWSIGFVLLARGNGKLYLITEFLSDAFTFAFNLIGYEYWGLGGVGASYTIGFIFYLILIYAVCKRQYNIEPGKRAWQALAITVAISATTYATYIYMPWLSWCIAAITTGLSGWILYKRWKTTGPAHQ